MSQVENYSFDAVACQLRFLTLPTFISILNVTGFTYLIYSIQSDKTLSIITDDFLTTMLLKSLVKKSWVSDPNRLSKKNFFNYPLSLLLSTYILRTYYGNIN